ncbi:MAG: response regulator transcription factor [Collinsella sp.]
MLARAGFEIEACESFERVSRDILAAAPTWCCSTSPPCQDGQHICHEVRRESEVPIIVLTSRTTEIDEVMAMTLGADDFVPKSYSARVLVARINALLRRTAAAGERSTLVHKGLELDLARSMVTNTQTAQHRAHQKRAAYPLVASEPRGQDRLALGHHADLWDSDAFVDDNTLTVNINRLRTTLEKIGIKGYLTTHRGKAIRSRGRLCRLPSSLKTRCFPSPCGRAACC